MKPAISSVLHTGAVDACPPARLKIVRHPLPTGESLAVSAVKVGSDLAGPVPFPGVTVSLRQAAAIARVIEDHQPYQN